MIFGYTIPWNAFCGFILTYGYAKLLKYFNLNIDGDFLNIDQNTSIYLNF
ncbi:unnamed protein product [Paramecium octaurelia]|uniref:Uncharacterized protein n=1 Tax=Paramecium octaurelia TaxID=43137 RepID=A0A8S1XLP6_PAROT|nr:unnamed protein product [Paramecium octaurelia]